MKNHHRLMASVALAGFAVLLSACDKTTTAPSGSHRTQSVTATASIPANPTAPVTIQTTDPQSQVAVTIDPATLKLFATAAGGAGTLTMTDLAPKDYNQAPAGFRSVVPASDSVMGVFTFSVQKAAGSKVAANRASFATQPFGTIAWQFQSSTFGHCQAYSTWVFWPGSPWTSASNSFTYGSGGFIGGLYFFGPQLPILSFSVIITCSLTGLA